MDFATYIRKAIDFVLHIDRYLNVLAADLGPWLYVVLVAIVFCETGLVILPFLPGDSLLFAIGALAAIEGSVIDLPLVGVLLSIAAIAGDALNYSIGKHLGPKVFARENSRLLDKRHLLRAQAFYERYGGKTIFLARFIPIVRTFAPFVAGVGSMDYRRFATYNVTGGLVWVWSFLILGHIFGKTELVQRNFHLVTMGIIVISVLPIVFEWIAARRRARSAGAM